jgi:hypothetical protein
MSDLAIAVVLGLPCSRRFRSKPDVEFPLACYRTG